MFSGQFKYQFALGLLNCLRLRLGPPIPDSFFRDLIDENFVLSVIGQCYSEIPTEFLEAKEILKDKIVNWGFLESREKYRTES